VFLIDFLRNVWGILYWIARRIWQMLRWAVPPLARRTHRFLIWVIATKERRLGALLVTAILVMIVGYRSVRVLQINSPVFNERVDTFEMWFSDDPEVQASMVVSLDEPCPSAPFLLPTSGWIGLLYGDPRRPYSENSPHQGIDIFTLGTPGTVPVVAAYDGYITRLDTWTSAVIERVPSDPLNPERQIWLYYTHMAPASGETDFIEDIFPPGVSEYFVKQGTLLGYAGNYSGTASGISTHLHFSITQDDGFGSFTNESIFENTIDSSRYLGIPVNYACAPDVPTCSPDLLCEDAVLGPGGR
jgi:peptidoglycan LD-endopeptidase LytH